MTDSGQCPHCGGRMIWWAEDDLQMPWKLCASCDLPDGAWADEPTDPTL